MEPANGAFHNPARRMRGRLHPVRALSRAAGLACDGRYDIDQREQLCDVARVGAGRRGREGNAVGINSVMAGFDCSGRTALQIVSINGMLGDQSPPYLSFRTIQAAVSSFLPITGTLYHYITRQLVRAEPCLQGVSMKAGRTRRNDLPNFDTGSLVSQKLGENQMFAPRRGDNPTEYPPPL